LESGRSSDPPSSESPFWSKPLDEAHLPLPAGHLEDDAPLGVLVPACVKVVAGLLSQPKPE
jgi:hypothetical protein